MPGCSVKSCKNWNVNTKNMNIKYFSFPKDDKLVNKWKEACGSDKINLKHARVCSIHFSPNCFLDTRHLWIKKDAVPTINLKENENLRSRMPRGAGAGDEVTVIKKVRKASSAQRIPDVSNNNNNTSNNNSNNKKEKALSAGGTSAERKVLLRSKVVKHEDNTTTPISEIFSLLKSYYQKRDQNRDNCSVFGEHVANKLRNYDLLTRAEAEYKISCIIHEADVKVLQGSYASLYPTKSQGNDLKLTVGSRSAICVNHNKYNN